VDNSRRASYQVVTPDLAGGAVGEGIAELTPRATDPHDDTVDALVRCTAGSPGSIPTGTSTAQGMVTDRRLVLTLAFGHVYGSVKG
jgi:hypothetical protein